MRKRKSQKRSRKALSARKLKKIRGGRKGGEGKAIVEMPKGLNFSN